MFGPEELKRAAKSLEEIQRIDIAIQKISTRAPQSAEIWGESIKNLFSNSVVGFYNSKRIGEVVSEALINALLADREIKADSIRDIVEVPDAPCNRTK